MLKRRRENLGVCRFMIKNGSFCKGGDGENVIVPPACGPGSYL